MQTLDGRLGSLAFEPPRDQSDALKRERDGLRLLLEVSESITSHRDITELFQDLAQRLPRVIPFEVINLVLYDPAREAMRLHALVAPGCSKVQPGMEFPINETTTKFVWENQQPLMVEDVAAEERFPRLMSVLRE